MCFMKISSLVFFEKTHCETQAINLFFSDFLTTKFLKFLLQRERKFIVSLFQQLIYLSGDIYLVQISDRILSV